LGYAPQGTRGGATKLSELEIDADKDWASYGIFNLKGLAAAMGKGDVLQHGDTGVLEKLSPGPITYELTSSGPGNEVEWEVPPMP